MAAARPQRPPRRRRQRSVRVTVSVGLLGAATLVVLAALPTRSLLLVSLASVLSLGLAWAALRIMWSEVLQSRRENAADRAAAASAYRSLFTVRAAEHAEFTTAMTERLAQAHLSQRELEGLLSHHESRAVDAESRLVEAETRVRDLEQAAAVHAAEEADALASWEGAAPADLGTHDDARLAELAELAEWESKRPRKPRLLKEA